MARQKPIEVITPPNVLKAKSGGALPALDQRAIARAEAALEKMSGQFADWINEELAHLLGAWAAYEKAPSSATKDGIVLGRGSYDVSEDGQTMTATVNGIDGAGKPFEQVIVFDRGA